MSAGTASRSTAITARRSRAAGYFEEVRRRSCANARRLAGAFAAIYGSFRADEVA
jgi:hypothetical protein